MRFVADEVSLEPISEIGRLFLGHVIPPLLHTHQLLPPNVRVSLTRWQRAMVFKFQALALTRHLAAYRVKKRNYHSVAQN
jgi:hypothetical protein